MERSLPPAASVKAGNSEIPEGDTFANAILLPSGDHRTSMGPAFSLTVRTIEPLSALTMSTLLRYQMSIGRADFDTRRTSCLASGDQLRSLTLKSSVPTFLTVPVLKSNIHRRANLRS